MGTNRLEAFSDGVIAIIITIMVLLSHSSHVHIWTSEKRSKK
ncbi:TMEM175 family protein [Halothiobacillus sp.]|nr:TMEM175 family protein [Halothiobacillus sp.]